MISLEFNTFHVPLAVPCTTLWMLVKLWPNIDIVHFVPLDIKPLYKDLYPFILYHRRPPSNLQSPKSYSYKIQQKATSEHIEHGYRWEMERVPIAKHPYT